MKIKFFVIFSINRQFFGKFIVGLKFNFSIYRERGRRDCPIWSGKIIIDIWNGYIFLSSNFFLLVFLIHCHLSSIVSKSSSTKNIQFKFKDENINLHCFRTAVSLTLNYYTFYVALLIKSPALTCAKSFNAFFPCSEP